MSRSFLETKEEGKRVEKLLLPFLETLHGTLLEQPENAQLDYKGKDCWVEIKGRDPKYTSTDQYSLSGWMIGYNKIQRLLESEQSVFIYYYFQGDKTLWLLTASKQQLETLKPFKNFQGKLTVKVPKPWFTEVKQAV